MSRKREEGGMLTKENEEEGGLPKIMVEGKKVDAETNEDEL